MARHFCYQSAVSCAVAASQLTMFALQKRWMEKDVVQTFPKHLSLAVFVAGLLSCLAVDIVVAAFASVVVVVVAVVVTAAAAAAAVAPIR